VLSAEETSFLAEEGFAGNLFTASPTTNTDNIKVDGEGKREGVSPSIEQWGEAIGSWMRAVDLHTRMTKFRAMRRLLVLARSRKTINRANWRITSLHRAIIRFRSNALSAHVHRLTRRVTGRWVFERWREYLTNLPTVPIGRGVAVWTLMRWVAVSSISAAGPSYQPPSAAEIAEQYIFSIPKLHKLDEISDSSSYSDNGNNEVYNRGDVAITAAAATTNIQSRHIHFSQSTLEPLDPSSHVYRLGTVAGDRAHHHALWTMQYRGRSYISGRFRQLARAVPLYVHAIGLLDGYLYRSCFFLWQDWVRNSVELRTRLCNNRCRAVIQKWHNWTNYRVFRTHTVKSLNKTGAFLIVLKNRVLRKFLRLWLVGRNERKFESFEHKLDRLELSQKIRGTATGVPTTKVRNNAANAFYGRPRIRDALKRFKRAADDRIDRRRLFLYSNNYRRGRQCMSFISFLYSLQHWSRSRHIAIIAVKTRAVALKRLTLQT
jgi:hypothetical protein